MRNRIIPYPPILREYARELRNNSTKEEVLLWEKIKNRSLGVQFHRQVPLLNYIVDFYCHELNLAIEVDGSSHDNKQEYDEKREAHLQEWDVIIIRFTNTHIKKEMFSVILALEDKIEELTREQ